MTSQELEQQFVQTFVIPSRRERLLHELGHPKKRGQVFWHFAGSRELQPGKLRPGSAADLRTLPAGDTVLYIGSGYTGTLSLGEALDRAGQGSICIIFHPRAVSLWQGEEETGLLYT